MINLQTYDAVKTIVDYWIWIPVKVLYLKNIPFRKYYCFLCRYDTTNREYDYFLYLSDNKIEIEGCKCYSTNRNKSGTIKVSLSDIWDVLNINTNATNKRVDISLNEQDNNGEVYLINLNPSF